MQQNIAVLQLGSNLGGRMLNLERAERLILDRIGSIENRSHIYETESWGSISQNLYLNLILVLKTSFDAQNLLNCVLNIEKEMGRIRLEEEKYGDRTMDIDILFFNNEIIKDVNLVVPHPQIPNRKFVLIPLNEIMPKYVHPSLKLSIDSLLSKCSDPLMVKKVSEFI